MKTMHLFAGAGGGLLADLIIGHEPVVAVEWDAYCCKVLHERAADGWFPNLHVWEGDVRMFDPSEYAGRVDCIAAGFPCQDLSVAGNKAGIGPDTRSGLYREVLRIAGIVRPRFLFMENVSAILSRGLGTVLGDLAALGYDARWTCLPASAVGAPHYRDRWFLLAERADADGERKLQQEGGKSYQWGRLGDLGEEDVSDALGMRCQERVATGLGRKSQIEGVQPDTSANDCGARGWWSVESRVGRVAHGVAHWSHRIKALGNGQVPVQVAAAWVMLGGPLG